MVTTDKQGCQCYEAESPDEGSGGRWAEEVFGVGHADKAQVHWLKVPSRWGGNLSDCADVFFFLASFALRKKPDGVKQHVFKQALLQSNRGFSRGSSAQAITDVQDPSRQQFQFHEAAGVYACVRRVENQHMLNQRLKVHMVPFLTGSACLLWCRRQMERPGFWSKVPTT